MWSNGQIYIFARETPKGQTRNLDWLSEPHTHEEIGDMMGAVRAHSPVRGVRRPGLVIVCSVKIVSVYQLIQQSPPRSGHSTALFASTGPALHSVSLPVFSTSLVEVLCA